MTKTSKVCPECGHEFQGNGWDGIDAHWKAKHSNVMSYEAAWPLLAACEYKPKKRTPREDANQAAARTIREATDRL